MRRVKLYIAISLNGYIADANGSVEWLEKLPNPDKLDYGYSDFYNSIDTTIQGNNTYQQIMSWGIDFPYAGKTNYVFTRKSGLKDTKDVRFISNDHADFVRKLKEQSGKDIWLIGGGQINTMLLNENLIDELIIFTMPIVLPKGIDIFESLLQHRHLELLSTESHSTGAIKSIYTIQ